MDPRLIKRILVLAIWVVVWFLIVPLARKRGVSSVKWYFGALGAFYAPFLLITFGPLLLAIVVDKPEDRSMTGTVLDHLAFFALTGFIIGGTCLSLVRRKLKRLPDSSAHS